MIQTEAWKLQLQKSVNQNQAAEEVSWVEKSLLEIKWTLLTRMYIQIILH